MSRLQPATPRGRVLAAIGLAGAGAFLVVLGIVLLGSSGAEPAAPVSLTRALARADAAVAPFTGLTSTVVRVGATRLAVVVADQESERVQGLRGRSDVGPYDGELFAFDASTETAFTMAGVRVALDVGFYDARGRLVDRIRMTPCTGTDATCPRYQSGGSFRYALETLAGGLPRGDLSG